MSRQEMKSSIISAVLFGTTTAIFIGYYPVALLFGMFLTYPMALVLLAFASSVPFFFAGAGSLIFSDRIRPAVYSAMISWAILSSLFASLRPEGSWMLAIMIGAGIPASLLGHRIATSRRKELAIATSEIAHNILVHALVGEVRLRVMAKGDMEAVEVVASDYGPGIADLDRALQDGYSTANGLGLGLSSARRLVDDFDLASAAGRGTTVTLRKWRHGKD